MTDRASNRLLVGLWVFSGLLCVGGWALFTYALLYSEEVMASGLNGTPDLMPGMFVGLLIFFSVVLPLHFFLHLGLGGWGLARLKNVRLQWRGLYLRRGDGVIVWLLKACGLALSALYALCIVVEVFAGRFLLASELAFIGFFLIALAVTLFYVIWLGSPALARAQQASE